MTAPKRIGIAIVQCGGRFLVGVRGPDVALAGFAEFPGGKCHQDESAFNCAVRECLEEAGLAVTPQRLLMHKEFEYPHGRVDLSFVLCQVIDSSDIRESHQGFYWATVDELRTLRFPDANTAVVSLLCESNIG